MLEVGPPEGRAGYRAGGEETDSGEKFRVHRRGSVRRREDEERGASKSTGRIERVESSWGGVMADRLISKRLKGKVVSTCVTPAMTELQQ